MNYTDVLSWCEFFLKSRTKLKLNNQTGIHAHNRKDYSGHRINSDCQDLAVLTYIVFLTIMLEYLWYFFCRRYFTLRTFVVLCKIFKKRLCDSDFKMITLV